MEGNQTRFVESSDSDIKKLFANAVPESTKKSTKYLRDCPQNYQPTCQPPEGVYLLNNCLQFFSSIECLVWKLALFEVQSYGGA